MSQAEVLTRQEYDAALARVAAYRDQLERADRQADQNSLDRARDLELLYQAKHWVDEMPAPKNKVWRGRPVDPESRDRFAKWALQKTGLTPSRVGYLHRAHDVVTLYLDAVQIKPTGEFAVRPFARLRRAGYGDRIPEVYKRAVELAEGRPPTSAETRQAVRDFLAQWNPAQRHAASKAETANRHRLKAKTAVEIMLADGDQDQLGRFHQWYMSQVTS